MPTSPSELTNPIEGFEATPFDFDTQRDESSEFINRFRTAIPQIRGRVEDSLGLGALRERSTALGETIGDLTAQARGIPQNIGQQTSQSLVTQGQQGRLVQNQQRPIIENITRLTEAQAKLTPFLAQQERLGEARFQSNLLPFELEHDDLTRRMVAEQTGWSTQKKFDLDSRIASGNFDLETVSLAVQESAYRQRLEEIRLENEGALARVTETGSQSRQTAEAQFELNQFANSAIGYDIWNSIP